MSEWGCDHCDQEFDEIMKAVDHEEKVHNQ